jgi:dinuclear metal center YbgI/SA1388 family protein
MRRVRQTRRQQVDRARMHGETVGALCDAMERIAPTRHAAAWDNVGLLAGSRAWSAQRVLLTIDLTRAVLEEARRRHCGAVVSYHPPIFKPAKRWIVDDDSQESVAAAALAAGIAVYSPHTALDAAPGGTNEMLANLCGLKELRAFPTGDAVSGDRKLVVFVPLSHAERVAEAMFAAGAGRIGAYEKCSYRLTGVGTFFGGAETNPRVGRRGRLEQVEEIRMEMVCPAPRVAAAVTALRRAHPYEEPAYDVYPLVSADAATTGLARFGTFTRSERLGALAASLKRRTRAAHVVIVGDPGARLRRGVVCAGSAGDLPFQVDGGLSRGDVVITGELRHHDALRYQRVGAGVIALGHWASERPVLAALAARLKKMLPGADCIVSRADVDPFRPVR